MTENPAPTSLNETRAEAARLTPVTATPALDQQVVDRVLRVVAANQKIALDQVALSATFEELGMDSLDGVNLVFAIEEEFDIAIPDDAAKNIRGVREMADGVERLLREKAISQK